MFSETVTSLDEDSNLSPIEDLSHATRTDSTRTDAVPNGIRSFLSATTAMVTSIMLVATPTATAMPRKSPGRDHQTEMRWIDSSTFNDETALARLRQQQIIAYIKRVFAEAREMTFEDGIATSFSLRIEQFIRALGQEAIEALTTTLRQSHLDAEAIGEALRWIGKLQDPSTHNSRRQLLERALDSSSSRIRDGAGLGIAFLDDPIALPALTQAIKREPLSSLKADLELVRVQLIDTQTALA